MNLQPPNEPPTPQWTSNPPMNLQPPNFGHPWITGAIFTMLTIVSKAHFANSLEDHGATPLIPATVILLMDEIRPTTCYLSHRIHVWYICLHFGLFFFKVYTCSWKYQSHGSYDMKSYKTCDILHIINWRRISFQEQYLHKWSQQGL